MSAPDPDPSGGSRDSVTLERPAAPDAGATQYQQVGAGAYSTLLSYFAAAADLPQFHSHLPLLPSSIPTRHHRAVGASLNGTSSACLCNDYGQSLASALTHDAPNSSLVFFNTSGGGRGGEGIVVLLLLPPPPPASPAFWCAGHPVSSCRGRSGLCIGAARPVSDCRVSAAACQRLLSRSTALWC